MNDDPPSPSPSPSQSSSPPSSPISAPALTLVCDKLMKTTAALERLSSRILDSLTCDGTVSESSVKRAVRKCRGHLRSLSSVRRRLDKSAPLSSSSVLDPERSRPSASEDSDRKASSSEDETAVEVEGPSEKINEKKSEDHERISDEKNIRCENVDPPISEKVEEPPPKESLKRSRRKHTFGSISSKPRTDEKRSDGVDDEAETEKRPAESSNDESLKESGRNESADAPATVKVEEVPPTEPLRKSRRKQTYGSISTKPRGDEKRCDGSDSVDLDSRKDSKNINSEKNTNFKSADEMIAQLFNDKKLIEAVMKTSENNDCNEESDKKSLSLKCVNIKNLLTPEIASPFPMKSPKTVTFGNIRTHKGLPSCSSPLPALDAPVKSILVKNKCDKKFVSEKELEKIKKDILENVAKKPSVLLKSAPLSGDALVEHLKIHKVKRFRSVDLSERRKRKQIEAVEVEVESEESESSDKIKKKTRSKTKVVDEKEMQKKKLLMNSDSEEEFDSLTFRLIKKSKKKKVVPSNDEDEDTVKMGRSQRMKGRAEKCIPVVDLDDSSSNGSAKDAEVVELVDNEDDEHSIENGTYASGVVSSSNVDAKEIMKRDLLDDNSSGSESKMNGSKNGASSDEEEKMEEDNDEDLDTKRSKKKSQKKNGKTSDDEFDADLQEKDEKILGETDSDDSEVFKPSRKKRKPKKQSSGESNDSGEDSEGKSKAKKRKRIKKQAGDDSDQDSGEGSGSGDEQRKTGRKNIRKVKKSGNLDAATRIAAKKEKERLQRIAERQRLYNESMFDESGKPDEAAKLEKIVLDFDPKTKEPSIQVDKGLVEKLKPHQANGIKFMWEACFESAKQISETKGSGCILAHCMGLGKTLQVVTLVHTLLTHQDLTKVERVLVVCPLSTVLNWVNEFRMWLKYAKCKEDVNIYELSRYKQNYERSNQLKDWLECGGVCVLGYEMFRNLSADNNKKFKKAQLNAFQRALVDPGPDLVVCDEGHLLKNEKTSLSQSMNRVRTLRRIVLTGTPLQNNLKEYYCMVQFVKPNLLGKYNEYLNRFVNPITNGQYTDSTDHDIRVMKRRSHVLHKMLDGAVQRRDYSVLAPFLPPKHEYVLFISLTEIQVKLYSHYLENFSRRPQPDRKNTGFLFPDFQSLQRIWTHPLVLKANSERYELMQQKKRDKENSEDESEGSIADFIDDDEDEEDLSTPPETSDEDSEISLDSDDDAPKKKKKGKTQKVSHKRVTRANVDVAKDLIIEPKVEERQENPTEWWMSLTSENELDDIRHSNKLLILLDILKMCDAIGDKLLVFSQSLYSLDLIEQFLAKIDDATQRAEESENLGGHTGSWSAGVDYFRLDGSTSCENRALWCKHFNREDNPRARLFLISTRAGGLGINLVAANRVVIFDMSWNPSHDVQSIFRVYRFGQKKPCYIYRFLALGTMEEKIYERQVTKQAISKRVIDEQQIDRHYAESDLAELYTFNPVPDGQREVPKLPKDRLFADLLKTHDTVIYKYHEHDSLLENKEEETLTEEERKAAWEDYENEKTRPPPSASFGTNFMFGLQQQQQQQIAISALSAVLRQDYPNLTEQQLAAMAPALLQRMYQNGDPVLMQKMTSMMGQNSMLGGYKYPTVSAQPTMMNQGGMSTGQIGGVQPAGYGAAWQQQQQLQLQQLQQRQNVNMKYYAGGLGSRDAMDMAALQQQQRAMLLGQSVRNPRGRPPKVATTTEVVDLDSE